LLQLLNQNAGAVTALATVAILTVTAFYAFTTHLLFREAKVSRLLAGEPRVVAYLRSSTVHSGIVQLCIANLSGAAATAVSAQLERVTEWPEEFYFENSKILRDLSFLRSHEVLTFDLGVGPDLFRNGVPASFQIVISYKSLDGRDFTFDAALLVESVEGHSGFLTYTIDDMARRLKDIADTLKGYTGFKRIRVETFDAKDHADERRRHEQEHEAFRKKRKTGE